MENADDGRLQGGGHKSDIGNRSKTLEKKYASFSPVGMSFANYFISLPPENSERL
jgi:hypothetical protein